MRRPTGTGWLVLIVLAAAGAVVVTGISGPFPISGPPNPSASADESADGALLAQEADTAETAGAGGGEDPAVRAIFAHREANRGPEQPIPFSHRFHVSELQLDCAYCHGGAERSRVAPMPSTSTCMGCHAVVGSGLAPIDSLRAYAGREEPVPWKRVYKVPEFVQFDHRPHLRNGIECQECHGPVGEMDRLYAFSDLSMGWCLTCHRGDPAESDVATDRVLAERFPAPEGPGGRQSTGLYPRRIDSEYAAHRAPIDCAACHY